MSYLRSTFSHPALPTNDKGYKLADYRGGLSTLCAGCGHDSICTSIIQACFELDIEPYQVAKMSGIGCSSKTPAYYLDHAHGFNSLHGRMPSVTTGANLANKDLVYLCVSGDGDTASIGMGQFVHAIRRNVNMTYIVMNNGCYGLTKGQESATADKGSVSKKGAVTQYEPIDLVGLALELNSPFVARSFSGDKEQLVTLIKLAVHYPGFALIDVISPCVTFNNHKGSTKSYDYIRAHNSATHALDFVEHKKEITVQYGPGQKTEVALHDGSIIKLNKLAPDWNPYDLQSAKSKLAFCKSNGEVLTGLIHLNDKAHDLHTTLGTVHRPLNRLTQSELCPGSKVLDQINESFR